MRWRILTLGVGVLLALLLAGQALAVEVPGDLQKALPAGDELAGASLEDGLAALWGRAAGLVGGLLRAGVRDAACLLLVLVLCGVGEGGMLAVKAAGPPYVLLAGTLAILLLAAGDVKGLMGMGVETITELEQFSKVLLPSLTAATAAMGHAGSAAVRQMAAAFFSDVLLTAIRRVFVPMTYLYIGLLAANTLLGGGQLEKLAEGLKKLISWSLKTALLLFTGYLTVTGAAAGAADALTVKLARTAISSTVPVVGGVVANAAETVLAGAAVLRGTIGVFGILGVLSLCLLPFLRLTVQYLLYMLVALAASALGPKPLAELLEGLGGAFGLILGMTGSAAMLLLIAILSSLLVVTA